MDTFDVEKKYLEADLARISNDLAEMAAIRNILNDKLKTLNSEKSEIQDKLISLMRSKLPA